MSKAFARVVRAFVVCESLTHEQLMHKADVSSDTARQARKDLLAEGLIEGDKKNLPQVYKWVGDFKQESLQEVEGHV